MTDTTAQEMAGFSRVTHFVGMQPGKGFPLFAQPGQTISHTVGGLVSLLEKDERTSVCGLLSPLGQLRAWEGRDRTGAEKGLGAAGKELRAFLTTRVVTSCTWNQAMAEDQGRKLGFL